MKPVSTKPVSMERAGVERIGNVERTELSEALDRLWTRFLPEMRERVATVRAGVIAYANQSLTPGQQEASREAAHKLAGVLGTFGLGNGTVLARELEIIFCGIDKEEKEELSERLNHLLAAVTAMIENRKA